MQLSSMKVSLVDLWEIENNVSDIFVYHGHTLTSRLEVSKAFKAIKEYAFDKSSFPLILQLEIHLSIDLQFVLVDLLKSIFDDHLYLPPPSILVPGSFDLPSPDELRHKILIKGKKLDAGFVDDSGEVTEDDESAEAHFRTGSKGFRQAHGKKYMLLCRELSDLMCPFLKSTHYSDFQSAFEQQQFHEVCSMNEAVASRLANACPEEFVTYTRRFLTRIYPSGVRVDSSNFNPQEFWNCGCQIACMNFQTPGLMIDLNLGKFSANGGCGYVLKPSGMRDEFSAFSLRRDSVHGGPTSAPGAIPNILHLKIISAQHLPRPRGSTAKGDSCDPYVVIEIFGIPGDCAEERTKTVRNDSFNPFFDESFEFHIQVPDLALIRLLVLDDEAIGDDFIGQFTIPFDCLQTGYRHITLMSANSEPLVGTTLFVHLAITNKRGGGKAHKRGRSVMKKRQKIQTGIKQLGIKKFDESFKNGQNCLVESIQLRTALENHLSEFQSACGATGASGTIKQGMKILTSRIQNGSVSDNSAAISNGPQFKIVMHNQTLRPEMDDVTIPDVAKKCLSTFERLLHSCVNVRSKSDPLLNKLSELHKRILELYEDMGQLCLEAGLKEQKAIRASENFAWNVRIVKAQIETLSRVQKEAIEILNQMEETSAAAGQLQVCTEDPCTHI